jgi:hypothetical protein
MRHFQAFSAKLKGRAIPPVRVLGWRRVLRVAVVYVNQKVFVVYSWYNKTNSAEIRKRENSQCNLPAKIAAL